MPRVDDDSLGEDDDSVSDSLLRRVARIPALPGPAVFDRTGTRIGPFVLRGRRGRGGMGVVYEAFDEARNATVALKMLHRMDAADIALLKHEFRSLADVAHPNLVTLYELMAVDDQWFFTMELVDGVDFVSHVRPADSQRVRIMPSPNTVSLAADTTPAAEATPEAAIDPTLSTRSTAGPSAEPAGEHAPRIVVTAPLVMERLESALGQLVHAVMAIHAAGKLHRDLKPSNVLVRADGRLTVLDFGLVKGAAPAGQHSAGSGGDAAGTPAYMAPEQARGEPLTPAADWYAVGGMLYHAIAGEPPFRGSIHQVLERKQRDTITLPPAACAGVPAWLIELCHALLAREPRDRPTGEDILRALGHDQTALHGPPGLPPAPRKPAGADFIGRARELGRLHQLFAQARAGRGALVLIHGSSGMGKSALAQCFVAQLEEQGALVLAGRCYEREAVPFKAWDTIVDALAGYLVGLPEAHARALVPRDAGALVRVFPVLGTVPALAGSSAGTESPSVQVIRQRAVAALEELCRAVARTVPLVLYVDDLQWGDPDSARLLCDVLGPPDPPPLLFLGTYRTEEEQTSPFLRTLLGTEAAAGAGSSLVVRWSSAGEQPIALSTIALGPLARDESQALASQCLGARAGQHAQRIVREAGGNPFLITELARQLEHALHSGAGDAVERLALAPIVRLQEPVRRLLEVVAVAGRPIEQGVAAAAAGLAGDARAAFALLRAELLVRSRGAGEHDPVEIYHDRLRKAVLASLEPEVLREYHLRLAEQLEATGRAEAEALATHLFEAGEPGRAREYALVAAAQAERSLAFDRAARLYRMVLELDARVPAEAEPARALYRKLGYALYHAGRGVDAAAAYLEAARGAPEDEALDCQRLAAEQLLIAGHVDEGMALLSQVLAAAGVRLPRSRWGLLAGLELRRGRLVVRGHRFREQPASAIAPAELRRLDVCFSALLGLANVDLFRSAYVLAEYLVRALAAGEPSRIALGLAMECSFLGYTGALPASTIERTATLARKAGNPLAEALLATATGMQRYMESDLRSAVELAELAERILRDRCTAVAWALAVARRARLRALAELGELDELARLRPVFVREAEDVGDLYTSVGMRVNPANVLLRLAADDCDGLRSELAAALARWRQRGFQTVDFDALLSQGLVDLYQGEGQRARARLEPLPVLTRRWQLVRVPLLRTWMSMACGYAALAAAAGAARPKPLLDEAERAAQALAREPVMRLAHPTAALLRAGIAAARGRAEAASALLEQAERDFDRLRMALHVAAARYARGWLQGGDAGRALVTAAEAAMQARGVARPERLMRILAPGPWASS